MPEVDKVPGKAKEFRGMSAASPPFHFSPAVSSLKYYSHAGKDGNALRPYSFLAIILYAYATGLVSCEQSKSKCQGRSSYFKNGIDLCRKISLS